MLSLKPMLIMFMALHAALGFVQLAVLYLTTGISYLGGSSGFLANTPLEDLILLREAQAIEVSPFRQVWAFMLAFGDTINGIVAFNYEMLTSITQDDGVVYWLVIIFRMITWGASLISGAVVVHAIFRSGILQSTAGLALVLGGASVAGLLSGLGLAID